MSTDFDGIPDDDIWSIDFSELDFQQEIARGSFGKVYRGNYLGVDVAIKQILRHNDPAYMKYIEREISVLKGIRHPFCVAFNGVCLHDTGLYIVTEYIDGGDVRQMLKTTKPGWKKKVQIATELAKAMHYLHSKKIIHRDLKSKNLLIGNDGHIRLCDFGFARLSEFSNNRAMTICGTPGFVAPEIMLGLEYDFSCDVFSFGNVVAELITLQRPAREFWNRTADDNYQLDYDELRRIAPKDTPKKLLDLCLRCVQYEPANRPDFLVILKELKDIEQNLPRENTNAPSPTPPPRFQMNTLKTSIDNINNTSNNNIANNSTGASNNNSSGEVITPLQRIVSRRLSLSSNDRIISEKHLMKMVHRGTTPEYFDPEYIDDFLLYYPCFTTPLHFMDALINRYRNPSADFQISNGNLSGPAPPQAPSSPSTSMKDLESTAKKAQVTRMRVIVLLKTWIEKYVDDFSEPGMADLIVKFDQVVASQKDSFSIQKLLTKGQERKLSRVVISKDTPRKSVDPHIILNVYSALDIAKQITYIDIGLYKSIQPREFVKESWIIKDVSNIRGMRDRSEELSKWTATAIMKTDNKDMRINLIQKFIEIAQACLTLKNFNGLFSILAGLSHPAVERLGHTLQGLKPSFITSLKTMKELTSKDSNYKNYKAKIETTTPPLILYLEPFLEEIIYIDESNQDIGKGGIINFTKHRQMARIVKFLLQYQHSNFPEIKPIDQLQDILLKSLVFDDEQLKKQSLLLEPPSSFIK